MAVIVKAAPRTVGPNPPGLAMVIPIPADQIISMPEYVPNGELDDDLLVLNDATVHAFWVHDLGGEFEERLRVNSAGGYYDVSVEFLHVGPEAESDAIFRPWKGREFCLLATTNQGKRLLIGSKERPLQVEIRKTTGSLSGLYGYRLSFQGEQLWPAPRMIGEFVGGNPEVPPAEQQMIDWSEYDFTYMDFY
ncbi:hypothetical protein D770_20240 [Flammeovirgaceae bacterium 311]|nr:hypothetical protein D770_20240 [Flammeovirgaceae bacterium 311]